MRRDRVILGTLISAIGVLIVGIAYAIIAGLFDDALNLPSVGIPIGGAWILAGMTWSLGLFWILWAYSYLIYVGSGSPVEAFGVALEPTKRLVTTGPYAYVRNPMIFGLLLIFLGIGFFGNSIMAFVLMPVSAAIIALYLWLIEEPVLLRRFGVAYDHYRDHVPMFIPRTIPYVPPEN